VSDLDAADPLQPVDGVGQRQRRLPLSHAPDGIWEQVARLVTAARTLSEGKNVADMLLLSACKQAFAAATAHRPLMVSTARPRASI